MVVAVHIASGCVPYVESKEAIAHYPEILAELGWRCRSAPGASPNTSSAAGAADELKKAPTSQTTPARSLRRSTRSSSYPRARPRRSKGTSKRSSPRPVAGHQHEQSEKDVAKMTPEEADKATVEAINKVAKDIYKDIKKERAPELVSPQRRSRTCGLSQAHRLPRARRQEEDPHALGQHGQNLRPEPQDDGAQQELVQTNDFATKRDAYYRARLGDGGVQGPARVRHGHGRHRGDDESLRAGARAPALRAR